ncbi:hypothetical protein ANTQUA_LOCUS2533 [Anthophora quadrimaculata]
MAWSKKSASYYLPVTDVMLRFDFRLRGSIMVQHLEDLTVDTVDRGFSSPRCMRNAILLKFNGPLERHRQAGRDPPVSMFDLDELKECVQKKKSDRGYSPWYPIILSLN